MLGAKRYFLKQFPEWFLPLLTKNSFITQGGAGMPHERFTPPAPACRGAVSRSEYVGLFSPCKMQLFSKKTFSAASLAMTERSESHHKVVGKREKRASPVPAPAEVCRGCRSLPRPAVGAGEHGTERREREDRLAC